MNTDSPDTGLPVPLTPQGAGSNPTEAMIELVYEELKSLAAYHMRGERLDHTLQPTALVNEVYLRLAKQRVEWENKSQFICVAVRQIRRVLVDHARRHRRKKRGGGQVRVTLSDIEAGDRDLNILDLNEALDRLDERSPQDRLIVELKYFGGLREPEVAELLGIGVRTVRRRWAFARAWLFRELSVG